MSLHKLDRLYSYEKSLGNSRADFLDRFNCCVFVSSQCYAGPSLSQLISTKISLSSYLYQLLRNRAFFMLRTPSDKWSSSGSEERSFRPKVRFVWPHFPKLLSIGSQRLLRNNLFLDAELLHPILAPFNIQFLPLSTIVHVFFPILGRFLILPAAFRDLIYK